MKPSLLCVLLLGTVLGGSMAGCSGEGEASAMQETSKEDIPAIEESFKQYQRALMANDGNRVVTYLSKDTIDYYQQAVDLALTAGPAELNQVPVTTRMLTLTLRHKVGTAELRKMDGRSVFAYCVEQGWFASDDPARGAIQNIQVKGNRATAEYVLPGINPLPREFTREDGQWKNHIVPMFEGAVKQQLANMNLEGLEKENEWIILGLSLGSNKPVPAEIWQAPPAE